MTKNQKNEVIEALKEKFTKYNNFYVADTQSLSVAQVNKLRRNCFEKNVEVKVAKNTLIRKALEGIDADKYAGLFGSLNNVTALMFSENSKEPALIISSFRTDSKSDKPVLKAAYIDGSVFIGNDQLDVLKTLKGKQELLGELIGLLQSPAKNVISGLNAGNKLASLVKALEDRHAPQE